MARASAGLTIGAVAARTDVSVPVLRAWELRYGFPLPTRAASGHRRYDEHDVEQILRVVAERAAGLSLEAAIVRVRRAEARLDPSIFAGLRRHRPDLPVHVLGKRAMLAVSRAIEDQVCARAERPVLVASFQTRAAYRAAEPRWRELARTAEVAVVLADFGDGDGDGDCDGERGDGAPHEVPVPVTEPLRREWAVVCEAADASAVLSGWELPGQDAVPSPHHRYESLWSVEPDVVRTATRLGLGIARRHAPGLDLPGPVGDDRPPDPAATVRRATELTNRIIAYLDR